MKKYLFVCCFCCLGLAAAGQTLQLAACEKDALAFSPAVKAAQAKAAAALAGYQSSRAVLYPSLYLDAQGSWGSEIPTLQLGPQQFEFGSEWGGKVGPTLEYTLFDKGARSSASRARFAAYEAALQDVQSARRNALLNVRQAYFTVQRDLEHMYLASEQLKVARKQLKDVQSAYQAGAKSRLDVLMAQKQALRLAQEASAARGALGTHLRDLFKLTGTDYGLNPAYALDARVKEELPGKTTSVIRADLPENTVQALSSAAGLGFDENSPRLASLQALSRQYEYASRGYSAAVWPRVGLTGGAYWEYPNGPLQEDVFLGRAGVSVRLPLFEGGKNKQQARAQRQTAQAVQENRAELEKNLEALFYSSRDRLASLDVEEDLARQLVDAAQKSAALTYEAYKAGSVTFLEVDDANLSLLQSRIALSDLYIQRLNSLAVMDNLGR